MKCTYNVHIHIYIEHRNPETQKKNPYDFLVKVRNFYYPWVNRFFDIRREAQSFYAGFFICAPNTCGTRHKASASKRKSPLFFGRPDPTQLPDFFKIPQILRVHASCAWYHSHLVKFSLWDFYFDISEWHPPRTRVNTCAKVCT